MASERFIALLRALLEKTDARKIKWEETAEENTFRVGLGKGLVRVYLYQDEYYASLINEAGRVVDEISSEETTSLLGKLFVSARRSALATDELIDSMLADIGQDTTRTLPPEDPSESSPGNPEGGGPDDIPF